MVAANAIVAALFGRERTGAGAAISIGMFDVVTDWMSWALHQARATGVDLVPLGMSSPIVAPYGAYRTADEQVIVLGTTNDREWDRLAREVIGRPDLADDPRYATNPDRVGRRDELDIAIGQWVATQSFADASRSAEAAGIGWARYNTPTEVLHHPELASRGRWVTTSAPGVEFESLRPPADSPAWSWTPGVVPALGEHSEQVRQEFDQNGS
jgi:crotonobetainyl-CoA:carnitine CoA-transferase CaiB-like acyl-CoA transferase